VQLVAIADEQANALAQPAGVAEQLGNTDRLDKLKEGH
jgi:hypothetical protein